MSNVERYTGTGPRPASSLPDKVHYAQQLADADLLPASYRRKPGNVLLAVEYGEMLDVHPLTAIQQVHVIEGKLSMSAELMRAQVLRHGHRFRTVEMTSERAVVSITRGDDPDHTTTVEFTIADARNANLAGKGVWKQYPTAMLHARATSMAVRAVCPEVLMGISYTPEELGASVNEDGDVIDVTAEPLVLATQAQVDRIAELSGQLDAAGREAMAAWKAEHGIDVRRLTPAQAAEAIIELERHVVAAAPDPDPDPGGGGPDGGGEAPPPDPDPVTDDGIVEAVIVESVPDGAVPAAPSPVPEPATAAEVDDPDPAPVAAPTAAQRAPRPVNEQGFAVATRAELLDLMDRAGKGRAKVMLTARNLCGEYGYTLPAEFDGITEGPLLDALVSWLRHTCLGEDPATAPTEPAGPPPVDPSSDDHRRLARRMHAAAADAWGRGRDNETAREHGRKSVIRAVTGGRTESSSECTPAELREVCDTIGEVVRGEAVIDAAGNLAPVPVAS